MKTNGNSARGVGVASTGWATRKTRRSPGCFALEALEPRTLLSTIDLAALKADGDSPTSILGSDQWLVTLNDPAFANTLRNTVGARSVQSVGLLSNTFVLNMPNGYDRLSLQTQLQSFEQITAALELTRQQYVPLFVSNDPLFEDQWHLDNTGQTGGTVGADANVLPVWSDLDFTGDGVVIGIVDDGLQYTHPDLSSAYDSSLSFDYYDYDANPSPLSTDGHGTAVAGVAAAVGGNGFGVSGVAPEATLAGLRLIVGPITDLQIADALTHELQEIDIYNNSWGSSLGLAPLDDLGQAALEQGVTEGRGGLGAIYVFAAGNGLLELENSNYDGYAASRYTIAVSAIDHNGQQSYYSEPGANILVAGYSGSSSVNITTTDLVGINGYSSNSFTDSFSGTSSAAPLVSGVIALMLQANPNLTWRDVQHILVNTSTRNDAGDDDWTQNGAGLWVNHKYGFGAVDAEAAVNAALAWTTVDTEISTTSGVQVVNVILPDDDATGHTASALITDDLSIETVEVVLDVDTTYRGDLRVVLTSPDGTESVLAEPHLDSGNNFDQYTFSSVRHWGESSAGVWTLKVSDELGVDIATFNNWTLNIYGTESTAGRLSGTKFNDLDRDGTQDDGEEGLEGWTMYVDANLNGEYDAGERFAVTDADGAYTIRGLDPVVDGEDDPYRVREIPQAGWAQSYPALGYHETFVGEDELITGLDFGNYEVAPDIQIERVVGGGPDEEIFDGISSEDLGTFTRGDAQDPVTFRITNVGVDPLVLGAVTVPDGFVLLDVADDDFNDLTLNNGDTVTFRLAVDTSTQGSKSGTVSIRTNVADEDPFDFVVSGEVEALPAVITVLDADDNAITDGQMAVIDLTPLDPAVENGAGPTYTFTVRNDGDIVLGIGKVTLPTGFSIVESLNTSLAAGESDTFTIQLDTSDSGTFSGALTIANTDTNDPDDASPHAFSFNITGIVDSLTREIIVFQGDTQLVNGDVDAINFGATLQGSGTLTKSFTVRNDGEGDLVLQTPVLPAGYTLIDPLATRLSSGQSDTFIVRLDHAVPGVKAGNIVIASNDPDDAAFSIAVSGEVIAKPAPDLTPLFVKPALTAGLAFLPGDVLPLDVTLQNQGSASAKGKINVQAYLSSDNALSNDDILVSQMTDQIIDIKNAESGLFDLDFKVPRDLEPGNYFVIVKYSGALQTSDSNTANDTEVSAGSIAVRWWFGEYNGRKTNFTVNDPQGMPVNFALEGPGYGEIDGPGFNMVSFHQTTRLSHAAIKVDPQLGSSMVGGLEADNDIGSITLSEVDLDGNMTIDGRLLKFAARNVMPGSSLAINSVPGSAGKLKFTANNLTDVDLTTPMPLKVAVNQWTSSDPMTPSTLNVSKISKLMVAGDVGLDVILTEDNGTSLKKMYVGGTLSHSSVRAAGSIGNISVGRSVASTVFAGVSDVIFSQPDSVDDFDNRKATIGNFTVRGLNKASEPSYQGSMIAAWRIGSAKLVRVDPDNGGDTFGITAAFVDQVQRQTAEGMLTLKKLGFIDLIFDIDTDYRLQIVA